MSRSTAVEATRRAARREAGFTLIEVLVALSVVTVALAAIGSLIATTVRGIRGLDSNLAQAATARTLMTALPDRAALRPGSSAGESGGHRWRIDVQPFRGGGVDPRLPTVWEPQAVVLRVESPSGRIIRLDTVRLRQRTGG